MILWNNPIYFHIKYQVFHGKGNVSGYGHWTWLKLSHQIVATLHCYQLQDKPVPRLNVDCTIIQRQFTSHEQDNFITGVYHCLAEQKACSNIGYSMTINSQIQSIRGGQQKRLCEPSLQPPHKSP